MGISENLVKEIARRIAAAKPDKIILFGSGASGEDGGDEVI